MMWLGCTCWAASWSVIRVSAFCSVGALAIVSFRSLLTSLVTARARGSLSHLQTTRMLTCQVTLMYTFKRL